MLMKWCVLVTYMSAASAEIAIEIGDSRLRSEVVSPVAVTTDLTLQLLVSAT